MSKPFTFNALKNIKQTGSLFRSSKFLAKELTKPIEPCKNYTILELGAGDGVITKQILNVTSTNSMVYSYEINPVFLETLGQIKNPKLKVLNKCVSKIDTHFDLESVDFIISSLPLTNFSKPFKQEILDAVKKVLKPDGLFLQYQYTIHDLRLLQKNFKNTKTSFCVLNIPPAFIYHCKK